MNPIRIVWGTGTGPTELAAYDAALAAANVHDYNLVRLSSVIPAGATVEEVGRAPDLGATGNRLHVVEAAAATDRGTASAALAWARAADETGIFYEASGCSPPEPVIERVTAGIESGRELRDREFGEPTTRAATVEADDFDETYAAAVVSAVYGDSEPLLE